VKLFIGYVYLTHELVDAISCVRGWIVGSAADDDVEVWISVHGVQEGFVAHLSYYAERGLNFFFGGGRDAGTATCDTTLIETVKDGCLVDVGE
jgi:hypothetical protein